MQRTPTSAGSILLLPLLASCVGARATDPLEPEALHDRYVTVFLIDGLAGDVFREELEAGRLPHLEALADSGTSIRNGVTAFPSVSGYAHYPLVTGEPATRSGTFGLRWFQRDRERGNFRNYVGRTNGHFDDDVRDDARTLFEQVGERGSGTYNSLLRRGSARQVTLGTDLAVSKYGWRSVTFGALAFATEFFNTFGAFGLGDDVATNPADLESKLIDEAVETLDRESVQFISFTTLDNMNHLDGYRVGDHIDEAYRTQLRHIDALVGRYRERSRAAGTEARRIYLVTSDHGITPVHTNTSVVRELERRWGVRWDRDTAVRIGSDLDRPLDSYVDAGVDVVAAVQGNTMAYYYFRNPRRSGLDSWRIAPPDSVLRAWPVGDRGERIDLVEEISRMPGIELVMSGGGTSDRFLVTSRHGAATIRRFAGGRYAYRVEHGTDPLELSALADGVARDEATWLEATHDHRYPFAVPSIARLMSAHPDADLLVVSAWGYDLGLAFEFVVDNYRGGHGGLGRAQMIVPVILSGPGVRRGAVLPYALTEDVGATLQYLAGVEPARADGVLAAALSEGSPDPR